MVAAFKDRLDDPSTTGKNEIMMTLFDDTLLFDEGKKRYTNFELPDAELKLWEQFFQKMNQIIH